MKKILDKLGFRPRFCVWELTLACNMRCGHCGSRAGKPRADELTSEEAQRVCHELADLGCERVTLSGGEPTLRADWPRIARTLSDRGVAVNMVSNGWGWDEAQVKVAREAGLKNVCFSLDGPEAIHDEIRKKGSFATVMGAFEACRKQGLPTASITTINRKNLGLLDDIHDLLVERGVTLWQLQLSDPMGNQRDNLDWAFHPQELPEAEARIAQVMARSTLRIAVGDNIGYYGPHEEQLRKDSSFGFWVGCFAGCQVVGIEADGNIKGCLSQQDPAFVEGNLRRSSLKEIWERPGAFAYNRDFKTEQLSGFCAECQYNEICRGGCTCAAHFGGGSRFDNPMCVHRVMHREAQGKSPELFGPEREPVTQKPTCQPVILK